MTIQNQDTFINFILCAGVIVGYLAYPIPKQAIQVIRPRDWLTGLRWIILGSLVTTVIMLVPVAVYNGFRAYGNDYRVLRRVAGTSSNIQRISGLVFTVAIFKYRKRED